MTIDDSELKSDFNILKNINRNYKEVACLSLVRNSLNEGNEKVKKVIKNSVFGSSDTFDKIFILMLNNCASQIQNEQLVEVNFFIIYLFLLIN